MREVTEICGCVCVRVEYVGLKTEMGDRLSIK